MTLNSRSLPSRYAVSRTGREAGFGQARVGPDQLIEAGEPDLERSGQAGLLSGGEQIDDETGEHRLHQRRLGDRDVERHTLADQTLLDVRSPESDLFAAHLIGEPAQRGLHRRCFDAESDDGEVQR